MLPASFRIFTTGYRRILSSPISNSAHPYHKLPRSQLIRKHLLVSHDAIALAHKVLFGNHLQSPWPPSLTAFPTLRILPFILRSRPLLHPGR